MNVSHFRTSEDFMAELAGAVNARLNSVEDVMERLKLGRSKVFEVIGSGALRSIKVGRRRLVSEAALVDFISRLEAGDVAVGGDDAA
jgi:excisionase family DNA binding protein